MTRPLYEPSPTRTDAVQGYGIDQLFRRPAPSNGNAIFEIKIFEDINLVVVGDNSFIFEIPEDLDNSVLTKCETYITTVSSSGAVQVQVRNVTAAVDMLSTVITIDVGDKNSKDAGTQPVVNLANDDVSWGDHISIDVDAAGTGAKGLGIILYFFPAATVSIVLQGYQGATGATGGVTAWTGQWTTATAYTTNQAVSNNGSSYVARTNHTSGATSEPGVGATWGTYWQVLSNSGSLVGVDGWTDDTAATWTYASATTFTVTGDQTAKFSKGTRIKLTQTTVKYFVVVGSSFGATTTVTVTAGSDYTLANAAISANYYSYEVNPQGYPSWFAYTATYTGFSTPPSGGMKFSVMGTTCFLESVTGEGTSNATGFTLSLPIASASYVQASARVEDNSAYPAGFGLIDGSGATVSAYKDATGAAWTASGLKRAIFYLFYEF